MRARAHLIAGLALVFVGAGPLIRLHAAPEDPDPPAAPQGGAQGGPPAPVRPPPITYPGSRSSQTRILKPDGTRVAVGKGVAWRGVKVYLSLLWDVVGVDLKTGKTLYAKHVGAFWNAFGFKEVTLAHGKQVWAVELRPGPRARQGKERRQYHDLRTGKKLDVPGQTKAPSGTAFQPSAVWSGAHARIAKPFHVIVSTAANWKTLLQRMFAGKPPEAFRAVDFDKSVVLVVSSGDSWNCRGISVAEAYEDDLRILLRTERHTFQTIGGGQQARPYGVIVLPRRPGKAYVVERNRQGLIGGPALWTESWRLARLGKPETELDALPAGTDASHDKWIK